MPELSPHEAEAIRLQRDIAAMVRRDRELYQDRVAEAHKTIPAIFNRKMKKDPRGSKPNVKRGRYKKHVSQPPTQEITPI